MSRLTPYILNDGTTLPPIGFGTYPMRGQEGTDAVRAAIAAGYRLIDTAVNYENEDAVGRGIALSGVPRGEIRLTTKLPGRHHGYDETLRSFDASLEALGTDYIDLYLIHWPNPSVNRFADSWRAMVELKRDKRVRSIGVSNFTRDFLLRIGAETGVMPSVNQIEVHPYFPQEELIEFHREQGIRTEAWSPLGKRAAPYEEEIIVRIAEAKKMSPAQIVLRWHVERGVVPIPKSQSPERQRSNLDVFGFELTPEEIAAITALGKPNGRLFGGDPDTHEEM